MSSFENDAKDNTEMDSQKITTKISILKYN